MQAATMGLSAQPGRRGMLLIVVLAALASPPHAAASETVRLSGMTVPPGPTWTPESSIMGDALDAQRSEKV